MHCIIGGSTKGGCFEGGIGQGCCSWEEGIANTRKKPYTQHNLSPSSHAIDLHEDTSFVGNIVHATPPLVFVNASLGAEGGETSTPTRDSPHTTSCKKLGVVGKPNARKRSLIGTVHDECYIPICNTILT